MPEGESGLNGIHGFLEPVCAVLRCLSHSLRRARFEPSDSHRMSKKDSAVFKYTKDIATYF